MGIGDDFRLFCSNLTIGNRDTIAARYAAITRRLSSDFWDSDSGSDRSSYTGSYGRNTAINGASDVDMIMQLPFTYYEQYDAYDGNGQAALLQAVRRSIAKTYAVTDVGADGQVVVVPFTDDIIFEVVPAFINTDNSYTYPDSNAGGRWRVTNPKPEIEAIAAMDAACNYNLKCLCKIMRAWKDEWSVPMGGLLIDTLAHAFIQTWRYRDKSFLYYDWMSRDFFDYMAEQDSEKEYWLSPGANQRVYRRGAFEYKARRCCNIAKDAIAYYSEDKVWSARQSWREVYGTAFPE